MCPGADTPHQMLLVVAVPAPGCLEVRWASEQSRPRFCWGLKDIARAKAPVCHSEGVPLLPQRGAHPSAPAQWPSSQPLAWTPRPAPALPPWCAGLSRMQVLVRGRTCPPFATHRVPVTIRTVSTVLLRPFHTQHVVGAHQIY